MEKVPDVRNKTIEEAGRILMEHGFRYTTDTYNISEKSKVIDQFPLPETEVSKGSIIDLYLDEDTKMQEKSYNARFNRKV